MRLNGIVMHKALLLSQGAGRPGKRALGRAGSFPAHRKRLCKSANCIFLGEEGMQGVYLFFFITDPRKKKKKRPAAAKKTERRQKEKERGDLIEKSDSQISCKCNYFLRK